MRVLICMTALLGFAVVLAAATGAHSILADIRAADPASPVLRQWDQAILFAFVHVLAALGAAVAPTHERARAIAAWLLSRALCSSASSNSRASRALRCPGCSCRSAASRSWRDGLHSLGRRS